ncbi:MAG: hypothetical protein AABX65_04225 [Nanoarchaeota archaeon]
MEQVQDPETKLWRFQYPQRARDEQGDCAIHGHMSPPKSIY